MTHTPTASGTDSSSVPAAASFNPAVFQNMLSAMVAYTEATAPRSVPNPACASVPDPFVAPAPAPAPVVAPAPTPALAPVVAPTSAFRTHGPWVASVLYQVIPGGPLVPIAEENETSGDWCCIHKGLYVGVTLSHALATNAVIGVSSSGMKGYKTQAAALATFNKLLGYHMIRICT
ncbi:hypothetical protein B0H13DRAFT_264896 [Mycena leptocephala]|nr:hypothetical protein B0H13DRAFT_264896 [Mycena leptocephala]